MSIYIKSVTTALALAMTSTAIAGTKIVQPKTSTSVKLGLVNLNSDILGYSAKNKAITATGTINAEVKATKEINVGLNASATKTAKRDRSLVDNTFLDAKQKLDYSNYEVNGLASTQIALDNKSSVTLHSGLGLSMENAKNKESNIHSGNANAINNAVSTKIKSLYIPASAKLTTEITSGINASLFAGFKYGIKNNMSQSNELNQTQNGANFDSNIKFGESVFKKVKKSEITAGVEADLTKELSLGYSFKKGKLSANLNENNLSAEQQQYLQVVNHQPSALNTYDVKTHSVALTYKF